MDGPKFAKLFRNGSSQAVRLPQEFRFAGDRVRIRKLGTGVLIEPETFDLDAWLAEMRSGGDFDFQRDQPTIPDSKINFD